MEFLPAKIESERFTEFWAFATSVRRCASVAAKESQRLRGTWITKDLVVQKVHGYSLSSVRILCVVARNDEERQRLQDFFTHDRRNLRARFRRMADPLDEEQRVLVKIPYDSSLEGWVENEYQALQELDGLPGIPRLYGQPFFFENLGVKALALDFQDGASLQDRSGGPVEVYRMACYFLKVLEQVHQRGWIHGNLQPKDFLFHDPEGATVTFRQTEEEASVSGMICGWSRASKISAHSGGDPFGAWEERMPRFTSGPRGRDLTTLRAPSVFSAPEQYIALYTGEDWDTGATDLYRFGACVASALSLPRRKDAEEAVEQLRRLCHQSLLGQAAQDWELQLFRSSLDTLSLETGVFQVTLSEGAEGLASWLQQLLCRRGNAEPQAFTDAGEASKALQEAWSAAEPALIAAQWRNETPDVERMPQAQLVLEEPKLLAGMSIV